MQGSTSFSMIRSARQDRSVLNRRFRRETYLRVLSYAAPYRWQLIVLVAIIIASSTTVVVGAFCLKHLIDHGVTPGNRSTIITMAATLAGLALLEGALQLGQRRLTAAIGEHIIVDLRKSIFAHLINQPLAFFTQARTGALVTRVNGDVVGAQQAFATALTTLVGNTFLVLGVLGAMLVLSWQITIVSLALIPLFLLPARRVGVKLQDLSRQRMTNNAELGNRMTERFSVAGALLVKLYGRPAEENQHFGAVAERVAHLGIQTAMINRFFFTALATVASLATAMVYGIGGLLVTNNVLTVGALLSLAALLTRLYAPITSLAGVRLDIMTALVSFERVFDVLDLEPLVKEPTCAKILPPGPHSVVLDHVSYRYPKPHQVSFDASSAAQREPSAEVLRDISLTIKPGSMVAIVGPSGSGKTTLASLLLRLADPTSGQITVGGIGLTELSSTSLRTWASLVPQDAHMFHDTIRANLCYAAPDATAKQIQAALHAAQIDDVIAALPDGLDTVVGDRGHRLSGGEKQRLALARIFLKAPELVVLDEATAHLDTASEAAVQKALDQVLQGRTSVVIAHRLSTIQRADQIVVLVAGQIVQQGRHEDLKAVPGPYAELLAAAQNREPQPAKPSSAD